MNATVRTALLSLRSDLDEMRPFCEALHFGIITSSSVPAPQNAGIFWSAAIGRMSHLEANVVRSVRMLCGTVEWIDNREEAIIWWGDKGGIEPFKEWATKGQRFLKKHPDLISLRKHEGGWVELLIGFCSLAQETPDLAGQLRRTLENVSDDDGSSVTPPKVSLLEVIPDAITFSLGMVDHLLGVTPSHLDINIEKEIVMLNGFPYPLHRSQALILDLLFQCKGSWMSSVEMQEAEPELEGERIDRRVKSLPKELSALIETKKSKGYRLLLP